MKLHCLLISSLSVLFFNLFGCLAIYQACDAAGNCTCLGLFVETVKDAVSTVPKLFFSNYMVGYAVIHHVLCFDYALKYLILFLID